MKTSEIVGAALGIAFFMWMMSSDATSKCELSHSRDTCFEVLNR